MENPKASEKVLWAEDIVREIAIKTQAYSAREKKNVRIPFLKNAIEKITANEVVEAKDWAEFQERAKQVTQLLPVKFEGRKLEYGAYFKAISSFKKYVLKKFKYVPKRFYLKIWLVIGVGFGLLFGIVFGFLLPGIIAGIGIGLVVGSYQDKSAETNNRAL